jgi:hypothetical protein
MPGGIRLRSRRSAILLLFGTVFVLVGFSYLGLEDQITASPVAAQSYAAHLELMPLDVWAALFIGCGVVAVVAALARRHTLGFTALMGISSWWGAEFIASWITTGYDRAVLGALLWLLLVGVLGVVVGWRDPAPTRSAFEYDPQGG